MYDFPPGIQGWTAAGKPVEGSSASEPTIGQFARPVPTCSLDNAVGDVKKNAQEQGWDMSVVVNESNVVLGILRRKALESDPAKRARDVMVEGPSTYRPNVTVKEIVDKMNKKNIKTAIVTTREGKLVGMFEKRLANEIEKEQ